MKLTTFEIHTTLGRQSRLGLVLDFLPPTLAADAKPMDLPFHSDCCMLDLTTAAACMWWTMEQRPQASRWADFLFPPGDMRAFLELGDPAMDAARQVADWYRETHEASLSNGEHSIQSLAGSLSMVWGHDDARLVYRLDEIVLKTPITNPRTLRDFLTFETHVQNGWKLRNEPVPPAWYKMPVYYKGNPNTLIAPEESVAWPTYTRLLDYELELACVIGKEGRNIPEAEAGEYIAGYMIMNDFSARDVQKGEMACRLGPAKGKDFGSGFGPWLVTPDEIPDPRNLRMQARINGEVWSDGNSGTSYWTFAQMIAHVSREETLYPGDIIASGTVGFGCGLELDRWIQPGDTVELEIERLGILRNRILAPSANIPLYDIPVTS